MFGSLLPKPTLSVGEAAEKFREAFFLDKLLTHHTLSVENSTI